uniref:Uncharacterized protein n=1 Tax=Arundo donax TaxID=35708 RepID=A0A0A9Q4I3_ARUDO
MLQLKYQIHEKTNKGYAYQFCKYGKAAMQTLVHINEDKGHATHHN